jgi:glycosyltransferase involved in cell wall biosynthesis
VTSSSTSAGPSLAVVIPAYNAASTLPSCLAALASSERRPDEIILFDDGSSDRTAAIARAAGVRVLDNGRSQQGPAIGRNVGAAATSASTIVFVDADVSVHPEALGRLEAPLRSGEAVASFGSYDDRPRCSRVTALYANLRHHFVHQQGREQAFTFWSGLGAIRSDTFRAHHGFEASFEEPSIEDVELGIRIIEAGGRIRLVKDALSTHHKDWTLLQLWRTDVFCRAIPWARLMASGRGRADDLNISSRERATAIAAHLVLLALVASALVPSWWPALAVAALIYLFLNARFFAFLFRAGGIRAGLAGMVLHWCYHLYASVAFALVSAGLVPVQTRARRMKARVGSTQATRP